MRTLAALLILAALPALAADQPAPPVPADAPAIRDLFRPFDRRFYTLNPSGSRFVEVRDTGFQYWDDPDAPPATTSRQTVSVVEVATGGETQLTPTRPAVYTALIRWLNDRDLYWHKADVSVRKLGAELVQLGTGPDGLPEVLDVRLVGREAVVLSARDNPVGKVFVQLDSEDGQGVYLVDSTKPFEKQRIDANLKGAPIRAVDDWVIDDQGVVRAFSVHRRRGELRVYFRERADAPFALVYSFPSEQYERSSLEGFDQARGMLLVLTDHDSDKRVLRELDPRTKALGRIIVGDQRNDVSSAIHHPRTGKMVGVALNDSSVRFEFLDPRIKALQARLDKLAAGNRVGIVAVADDLGTAIAHVGAPGAPGRFEIYRGGALKPLHSLAPWLDGKRLGASRAIELTARDGVKLTGIYTAAASKRFERTPLIVMPHGGPFGVRDYLSYDAEVQFLATRGYNVLQVDFRGSGGYGRDFLKAGFKQWGRLMQDDITDAVNHAVASGWGPADRVCIYGASYGGYAAVMGLIKTPELYRCGATLAGVSDLTLLFKSAEVKENKYLREWLKDAIGDPEKEKAELQANSPAYLAKSLRLPLFIAHGMDDTRAEVEHAWRLRTAVEAGGGKVEWMLAPKEGHGFTRPKDIEEFYSRLDAFFAANLGG